MCRSERNLVVEIRASAAPAAVFLPPSAARRATAAAGTSGAVGSIAAVARRYGGRSGRSLYRIPSGSENCPLRRPERSAAGEAGRLPQADEGHRRSHQGLRATGYLRLIQHAALVMPGAPPCGAFLYPECFHWGLKCIADQIHSGCCGVNDVKYVV